MTMSVPTSPPDRRKLWRQLRPPALLHPGVALANQAALFVRLGRVDETDAIERSLSHSRTKRP